MIGCIIGCVLNEAVEKLECCGKTKTFTVYLNFPSAFLMFGFDILFELNVPGEEKTLKQRKGNLPETSSIRKNKR